MRSSSTLTERSEIGQHRPSTGLAHGSRCAGDDAFASVQPVAVGGELVGKPADRLDRVAQDLCTSAFDCPVGCA